MSLVRPDATYKVESFAPGFLDTPEVDALPPGATPDAKNCFFTHASVDSQGVREADLAKRPGSRMLTPVPLVAQTRFDGLLDFRLPGQSWGQLLGVLDGKVYTWNNNDAFTRIGLTTPFTAGVQAGFLIFRNLAFVMDGTSVRCWDGIAGSDLFAFGQAAPTAAPVLSDGGASTLPAATYEGFGIWYDSVHDHPSSPSAISNQVGLGANRSRNWTKPGGAPAANYDRWRIYCRRVDTNEQYFKRVVDTPIATANVTESVSDAARNLAELGPLPNQNDVPPAFALMAAFQGYRLGVQRNDDQVWVSRTGDAQSQNAKDVIGVSRGVGGEIRSMSNYGDNILIQKATRTDRLDGDRMPFLPKEVHSSFGNVGQRSGLEIEGRFYAWDQDKGPYVTDLTNWRPLATGRIATFVKLVNVGGVREIECAHVKEHSLVVWAVPTTGTRRRTLIAYSYLLESWLPPITGLEYAAIASYRTPANDLGFYVGDYWGRLFQYFTGTNEGVPGGTMTALSTANAVFDDPTRVECTGAAFYCTATGAPVGADLAGLSVLAINPANGARQWRRIRSNTATIITLDTTNDGPWDQAFEAGWTIVVGGIDWYWRSGLATFGDPWRQKKGGFFELSARSGSAPFAITLLGLQDSGNAVVYAKSFSLPQTGALWGAGMWGFMIWGGGKRQEVKARVGRCFFGFAIRLDNPYPDQPVELVRLALGADWLPRRLVASGGTDQPLLVGGTP